MSKNQAPDIHATIVTGSDAVFEDYLSFVIFKLC